MLCRVSSITDSNQESGKTAGEPGIRAGGKSGTARDRLVRDQRPVPRSPRDRRRRFGRGGGAGAPVGEQQRSQLPQRPAVDMPFEKHHFPERAPIVDPLPGIELGPLTGVQADHFLVRHQPEHEPDLFLADTQGTAIAPDQMARQVVAQPAAGRTHDLHVFRTQPHLFRQLPEQRLLGGLIRFDAALRKLPGILTDSPTPEQPASTIR